MKRAISLLLSMAMAISMVCTVSAAEAGTLEISGVERAAAGSEVEVVISIDDNPGIWGGTMSVSYDADLEYVSCVGTETFGEGVDFTVSASGNSVNMLWENSALENNITANGDIAVLTFKVPADATVQDEYEISIANVDLINQDEESVSFNTINGIITVDGVYTYTIEAEAGNHGSISPEGKVKVEEGASQIFTITADEGYHVKDVKVNGESKGALSSYTFSNVRANGDTITASFEAHSYEVEVTAHTCTTDGYSTYTCACGDSYIADKVDALGHDLESEVTTAPTCTATGVETFECSRCDYSETKTLEMVAHTPDGNTDCAVATYCTVCGTELKGAGDHAWNAGEVTTAPSCYAEGVKTYECTVEGCEGTKTEAVAMVEHTWDEGTVTTAPTCTAEGVKTYECTVDGCGATKTEAVAMVEHTSDGNTDCSKATLCTVCGFELKPAGDHVWNAGEVTTAPTCTEEGVKTYTCTSCGATKTEAVAASHTWDEGKVDPAPTCTAKGVKTFTCTVDGCDATKTESIDALGHNYVDGVCSVCGAKKPAGGGGGGGGGGGSSADEEETEEPIVTPGPVVTANFTDVEKDDWFYTAVNYVYEKGLMTGMSETTFEPGVKLSRAMIAQILYALEKASPVAGGVFTDVADGAWYADAVNWAASIGIVSGYPDGTFAPETSITREQLVAILYKYAQYKELDVNSNGSLAAYADADSASAWAIDALEWGIEKGIISGKGNGILDPQGNAIRAEVAQMLMGFCEKLMK